MTKPPSLLSVPPFDETPGFCGPASLKMVLSYYDVQTTEKELAKLAGSTRSNGSTAEGLLRAARKFGFTAFLKDHCTLQEIQKYMQKNVPVIVDWFSQTDGHYSVVIGIDEENIYFQDPQLGHMQAMELTLFRRVWFDFPAPYIRSKHDMILRRMIVITPKKT